MTTVTLEVSEDQIVTWVQQLSPGAKQAALRALIPQLDQFDALVDYGSQQVWAVAQARGVDWDRLNEDERQQLIDAILHEA